MWITKQEYRQLIERAASADARIEALTLQLNVMARANAEMQVQITGKPAALPVFQFQREATLKRPADWETGIDFNDMGDTAAHQAGFTES